MSCDWLFVPTYGTTIVRTSTSTVPVKRSFPNQNLVTPTVVITGGYSFLRWLQLDLAYP
jgi:hypothetical protein